MPESCRFTFIAYDTLLSDYIFTASGATTSPSLSLYCGRSKWGKSDNNYIAEISVWQPVYVNLFFTVQIKCHGIVELWNCTTMVQSDTMVLVKFIMLLYIMLVTKLL